jgi:hypothetical protein
MNYKLKAVGLALVAICAMGAISAAGAQARSFHSEVQTTYYTGTQTVTNVFTTTAGNVKCKKATFVGEATATGGSSNWTRETIEVTPTYAECTAFGQAMIYTTAGCESTLNANGIVESLTGCSAGGIVVDVPSGNCTVTIPNQHFTEALVSYTNEGAGASRDFAVTWDLTSKFSYTIDGPGTVCGTPGSYTDGSYTGTVTMKGYKDAGHTEQVGVWVE